MLGTKGCQSVTNRWFQAKFAMGLYVKKALAKDFLTGTDDRSTEQKYGLRALFLKVEATSIKPVTAKVPVIGIFKITAAFVRVLITHRLTSHTAGVQVMQMNASV